MKALSLTVYKIQLRLKFLKKCVKLQGEGIDKKLWCDVKGLVEVVTRNTPVKDESPICQGSGAMNNVKVYEK